MTDGLWHDLRSALRLFVSSPGFALTAIVSIGLGLGFNTALFSLVDAALLRPLPVVSPDSLVHVYTSGSDGDPYTTSSYPDYLDLRERNDVFHDLAGHSAMFAVISDAGRTRLVLGEVVTANYFEVIGVRAAVGRTFLPADEAPDASRVAIVSHRFWQRELSADPGVLGRTLRVRGQAFEIVGVAAPRFGGLIPTLSAELWIPTRFVDDVEPAGIQDVVPSPTGTTRLDRRGQRWLFLKGRLAEGISVPQAQANVALVMGALEQDHPATNAGRTPTVVSTREVRFHPAAERVMRPAALGLTALVGLVLFVACANVASLLLSRASARRREIGIRVALGAGRWSLARHSMVEGLVLALSGAAVGLLLTFVLLRVVNAVDLPLPVPLSFDFRVDLRVVAFGLALSVAAGLVASLMPAWRASATDVVTDLRGGGSSAPAGRGRRITLRDVLVAGQVAVTFVLLVAAGLAGRSVLVAKAADVGFETSGLALVSTDLELVGYDVAASRTFFDRTRERLRTLPGVEVVALADRLPFSINFHEQQFHVAGHAPPTERGFTIQVTRVSDDYFAALGVPVLEGRTFGAFDTPESTPVIVVNEVFARRFWPGESAVGRHVTVRTPDGPSYEVIGVVADHRVRTVGEGPTPYVHFAESQRPSAYQNIVVRGRGDAAQLLTLVRREVLALEPDLVIMDARTMEAQVAGTLLPLRFAATVASVVGVVALVLAAIGLYGVVSYAVARRTREIGIRVAIGADRTRITALVVTHGGGIVLVGLIAGGVLSALGLRGASSLLYGVSAWDPIAWGLAAATVVIAAGAAHVVPAWRASRLDPLVALKVE